MNKVFPCLLLLFFLFLFINPRAQAQSHQLVKKWQTDTIMKWPESVLVSGSGQTLYFSNIGGSMDGKKGLGSIGKLGPDGKIISLEWVKGLNGPKGLGQYKNNLYAADIDELVVIDIPTGRILHRIPVPGAEFLNDVTVDPKGIVYVSDTKTGKIHRVENGLVTTYVEGVKGANGVLAADGVLYVLGNGIFWKVTADKKMTKIADGMDEATDGIEKVKDNEFLVSSWNGIIYYVHSNGSKEILLDTRDQKSNTADIGFDARHNILYVPTFFKNSVAAYELK